MPIGLDRFQTHLTKLEQILATLPPSPECAYAFYKSPARQWLFYLEALTHLYKKIHNKKRFERLRDIFKSMEDQLGRIDYYDGFIKEFSVQENFPADLLEALKKHVADELHILDEVLHRDGWMGSDNSMMATIKDELKGVEWTSPAEERIALGEVINQEIKDILEDYHSGKLNFDDIENGVHEFRRKVRWISIYAQALDGLIQIKKVEKPDPDLEAYLTKEVVESPYNVMPALKEGDKPIWIEAPNFYALSWLIAESGKLKDEGLRIILLEDIIEESNFVPADQVQSEARCLAVKSTRSLKEIKALMKIIAEKFIKKDKVLQRIEGDIEKS